MTKKHFIIIFAVVVLIAGIAILKGFWLSRGGIIINRTQVVNLNEGANFIELNKQAGNFTVNILAKDAKTFLGNGIIVTADGLILTSRTVVDSQKIVTIVLNDGRSFQVSPAAPDKSSDLVFLNVPAADLTVPQFDDAGSLQAGQRIAAVGRSKKLFGHKFMPGFVTNSSEAFQTDLRLDADMIGGPLINLFGHVVALVAGPNQFILSDTLQKNLNDYLRILQNNK